jgi:hypothetical protein
MAQSPYGAIYRNRFEKLTAAKAVVISATVPSVDTTYIVSTNVLVTTATSHNFTVNCDFTDEGGTARTMNFMFTLTNYIVTTIVNTDGTYQRMGLPQHIRCKKGTTITIYTTGTFTTVVYNIEGMIQQMAPGM